MGRYVTAWPALLLLSAVTVGCTLPTGAENSLTGTGPVSPKTADELIRSDSDVYVLDIRGYGEYAGERLPDSVLIPLDRLREQIGKVEIYPEINRGRTPRKDQLIVCLCATGVRTIRAESILKEMGYTRVRTLKGGLLAWKLAGLPVEKGAPKIAE